METRKRIRLHELRMGMFVEELDNQPRSADGPFRPFLISTPAQIAWLMRANVISVVINVQKGLDLQHSTPQPGDFDRQAVEASLLAHFSPKDLEAARHSIAETKPDIRNVLTEARISGGFAARSATTAVERIMSAAMDNPGALIGVAKLKANDEVTYLHSLAVSALMIAFGRSLGLGEETIRDLGLGGLVHDIGKATVPHAVLNKPGKLSPAEFALVRQHPARRLRR